MVKKKSNAEQIPQVQPVPKPAYRKIIKTSAKVLFLWVPAVLLAVLIIALIALKLYLTPAHVENLIITNFNKQSNGTISLKVTKFTIFSGFVFEDILIKNGSQFDGKKIVEIKKIVYDHSILRLFIGDVVIKEIGIYKPRIYLEQKKGVWNAAVLMKPSEKKKDEPKKEEKKKEPEKEAGKGPDEISFPVNLSFFFKFVLDDLRIYAKGQEFNASMEGLTFTAEVDVPPFKKIPKSVEAVSIIRTMDIKLNPSEEMNLSFYSKDAEVSPPLIFTWNLFFSNRDRDNRKFNSRLKIGTHRTPVRFKQSHLAPLNFLIFYDMNYDPSRDHLRIENFGMKFRDKNWMLIEGDVTGVTKKQKIDIRMKESVIPLADLYPYYYSITHDKSMNFNGTISLFPMRISGTADNLLVQGDVNIRGLYFKNPSIEATVPSLILGYAISNHGSVMDIKSSLRMPYFVYSLGGERSGPNGIDLKADISARGGFSSIDIRSFGFNFFSPQSGKNALELLVDGSVGLKPALAGNVNIKKMRFVKGPLVETLPDKFKKSLAGVTLVKPVDLGMGIKFKTGGGINDASVDITAAVPDYDLYDLKLSADIHHDAIKKYLKINKFKTGSETWNLALASSGFLDLSEPPFRDSDIKVNLKYNSPVVRKVFRTLQVGGLVSLDARFKGDLKTGDASGSLVFEKFIVRDDEKFLLVNNMNLNFPFAYSFKNSSSGVSMIGVSKSRVIDNEMFREKPNFTIDSISSKHISRNIQFEYLKDFSASMRFKNNVFEISNLKSYLIGGSFYARSILFNLADLKKENMEFSAGMDVTNVDLEIFDRYTKEASSSGEISLNANFAGRGLDVKKELNVNGYINIFKIGPKFANRLMRALSTEKGKSKLGYIGNAAVTNFNNVNGFNFTLDKGLVYTTVTIKKGVLGRFLGVDDNKVEFDRIPIQEYLRKVASERNNEEE